MPNKKKKNTYNLPTITKKTLVNIKENLYLKNFKDELTEEDLDFIEADMDFDLDFEDYE